MAVMAAEISTRTRNVRWIFFGERESKPNVCVCVFFSFLFFLVYTVVRKDDGLVRVGEGVEHSKGNFVRGYASYIEPD